MEPAAADNLDFFLQELTRTLDATLDRVNPRGRSSGLNAYTILSFLFTFPGMEARLSPAFAAAVRTQLDALLAPYRHDATVSVPAPPLASMCVRGAIKQCLVWPRAPGEYAPWQDLPSVREEALVLAHAHADRDAGYRISLVDNKVCAQYVGAEFSAVDGFYTACALSPPWVKNADGAHVSLVPTEVAARVGLERARAFVATHAGTPFALTTGAVKCTFSEDWPRFSWCAVVQVRSAHIEAFLEAFNAAFGTTLRPSPHVTFAMVPRDIAPELLARRELVRG